ncbi:MAG TPA: pepsin/retropepsin-like aspartic protease family protein [Longimicrobium sp.]|nr:pepsin/retropepsin-like aspartic protease family protein [Longimicrobium sp.]
MNRPISIAALLAACVAAGPLRAQDTASLAAIYDRHDCFAARDALSTASANAAGLAFYRGWVAAAFNRPADAAAQLRRYLASDDARADARHRRAAENLLADVLVREFRYGEAADAYARVAAATNDSTRADLANNAAVFEALRGEPAQTVTFASDVDVPLTRDRANLMNVPVEAAGKHEAFVFDTGANLSTVGETMARELGFRIIDRQITVGTATGARASSRLAIAPELKIGGATARNVVFLVLPDSALSFPQIGYQIRGIVGHPVIAALGEVTLTRDGHLRAAARPSTAASAGEANLCLDGLDNLVRGRIGGQTLLLGLDTGARNSQLFPPWYRRNQAAADSGRAATIRIGGAGGMRSLNVRYVGPVAITIGTATATLPQVAVATEPSGQRSDYADGDIGQDVIAAFAEMTLDYRAMQLRFK